MSYGPRARDRYRMVVATLTGVTTVGAITSTGLIAGVAAGDHEDALAIQADHALAAGQQHAAAQAQYAATLAAFEAANAPDPQPLAATGALIAPKQRPAEERVATQYVAAAGATTVGTGGRVGSEKADRQPSGGASSGNKGAGSTSGSGGSDSGGEASAPPPPPPPPPPPSSGS